MSDKCHLAGPVARMRLCALALAVFMLALFTGQTAVAQDEFLHPDEAFIFSSAMADVTSLHLHFQIAPGYYMYRDRFQIDTQPPEAAGQLVFPRGTVRYDPTFDEDMEVYHNGVTLVLPLSESDTDFQVQLTSQGCADAGLCYPPRTDTVQLNRTDSGYTVSGSAAVASVPPPQDESPSGKPAASAAAGSQVASAVAQNDSVFGLGDTGIARWLSQASWYQVIGLSLLFGLLLTLTPCVLPMVPIVLAVVLHDSENGKTLSRWRGAGLAAMYVLGMSLVYTALGMVAGWLGASLAAWLQTPWVLALFATLLALLALAMFDVFSFQTPAGVQSRLNGVLNRLPGGRLGGAFFMGMLSALIVGPCVAAPLAGVLMFISQTGDFILGGAALFSMAWGQGLLLIVLGGGSAALLPRAGAWMEGIKRFFGWLLLATAWWMVMPIILPAVQLLGWAVLLLWGAVMLGAFEPLQQPASLPRHWLKVAGLLLAFWAFILLLGLAAGGRDVLRPLAPFQSAGSLSNSLTGPSGRQGVTAPVFTRIHSEADLDALLATADRPIMLDFYADWCVSCIEMERFTFPDPQVASQMAQFLLVQVDVTKNQPEHRALLKRFQLFGPPGIVFFDARGKVLPDTRVVGFKNAAEFATLLQAVQQSALAGRPAD